MDRVPIRQIGMLGVVSRCAVLETGDAGVVDQHVQSAMFGQYVANDLPPMGLLAHVQMPVARMLAQGGRGDTATRVVNIGQNDPRAFVDKGVGDGSANATSGAGH